MDTQTKLFLNRAAIKMKDGIGMEDAMQAVCDDDKRILASILKMAHENRKELANEMVESVFLAAKK